MHCVHVLYPDGIETNEWMSRLPCVGEFVIANRGRYRVSEIEHLTFERDDAICPQLDDVVGTCVLEDTQS